MSFKVSFFLSILLFPPFSLFGGGVEDLLKNLFPGGELTKKWYYLTPEEKEKIETQLKEKLPSRVVYRYLWKTTEETLYIYLDSHIVRTKGETLLVALTPKGVIRRVEIVTFEEPPEYKPPFSWLRLFLGPSEAVTTTPRPPIIGATLTTVALKKAIRRVVFLHRYLLPSP